MLHAKLACMHVIIELLKKGGRTSLHPTQPMAFPPLTVKARGRTARGLDGASPPPAKLARDSSADYQELRPHPGLVSHQEGLRFFEEGSREEPGRTLGRIVRDHGGSFPSTLTNLNRASRKKRSALDQTFCAPRRVLGLATGRQPINGCTREANSALL